MITLPLYFLQNSSIISCSYSFVLILQRQVKSAYRTGVIVFKPWFKAVWVVDMSTRHEHAFSSQFDVVAAYCAARWFKFCTFLAMLLFYVYNWQSINCFFFWFLCSLSSLSFLLTDSTNHLEHIVGCEIRVEVWHEVVRVEVRVIRLHSGEFLTWEGANEASEQIVDNVFDVPSELFTFVMSLRVVSWFICSSLRISNLFGQVTEIDSLAGIASLSIGCGILLSFLLALAMSEHKLRRRHLNPAHLHIVKTRHASERTYISKWVARINTDINDCHHISILSSDRSWPRTDSSHSWSDIRAWRWIGGHWRLERIRLGNLFGVRTIEMRKAPPWLVFSSVPSLLPTWGWILLFWFFICLTDHWWWHCYIWIRLNWLVSSSPSQGLEVSYAGAVVVDLLH